MADREEREQVSQQHAVPQNIMSVEFKLVGDLTIRQFAYLASGIVISFLINKLGLPIFFRYPMAAVFLLGGIGMAFLPIQDRGLDQWIKSFLISVFSPQQRVWRKNPQLPDYFLSDYSRSVKQDIVAITPSGSRQKVADFLNATYDNQYDPFLDKETQFLKHLNNDVKDFDDSTLYEFPEDYEVNKIMTLNQVEKKEHSEEISKEQIMLPKRFNTGVSKPKNQVSVIMQPSHLDLNNQMSDLKSLMERLKNDYKAIFDKSNEGKRKISDDIKLKNESKMIDRKLKAISFKTEDIDKLDIQNTLTPEIHQFRQDIRKLKEENQSLEKEISKQKKLVNFSESNDINANLKKRIKDLEADKLKFQKEIFDKPIKLNEKTFDTQKPKVIFNVKDSVNILQNSVEEVKTVNVVNPVFATDKDLKLQLTNSPNVINGIIKDLNGKFIDGAVVIIKDASDNPVRALKSNELGQFIISTPVTTGTYIIEVIKKGYKFDIISVVIENSVLAPILILGRII
jgi:hypothetical protein